jgi:eukaryotic-like serine/threonine-protein kinase
MGEALSRAPLCVGDFFLDKPVGRGGMGEVWGAVHRYSKARVAIKLLSDQRAKNLSYHNVFRREMRAAARLNHPNIVKIYDYGAIGADAAAASSGRLTEGSPYLVMEMVDGDSISMYRGRLPWPKLRQLLLDVLGALGHAHARGIIHRDIKFGNVLLGEDGVRLTDFGLAHGMSREDMGLAPGGGTPTYMSPEQFQGRWREFGPWTDLYALGCMAWILVTGRPPFNERGWNAKMHAHLTRRPPPLINKVAVPAEFEGWLRGMLRKDPELRFRRAADAIHALHQLSEPSGQLRLRRRAVDKPMKEEDTVIGEEQAVDPAIEVLRERKEILWDWGKPTMAVDWREDERLSLYGFCGAGLGLFGFRSIGVFGREAERELLWTAMGQVHRSRRARVISLVGAAGTGKTCLGEWLCRRAHELGVATILKTTHHPVSSGSEGISGLVSGYYGCAALTGEELETYLEGRLIGEGEVQEWEWMDLARMLDRNPENTSKSLPLAAQYALVQRILERLGRERPVLVFVDEAHWGLEAMELASYVLRYYPDTPVLFVFAINDTLLAERPAETDAYKELQQLDQGEVVILDEMDPHSMALLIRELLQMSGDLPERVHQRVGGNPLYAVQLVSNLVQRQVLIPGEHGLELKEGESLDLPGDVLSTWFDQLERVLGRLPEQARLILEVGVALGSEIYWKEWLQACSEEDLELRVDWVEALVDACLLRELDGSWRLANHMLTEVVSNIAKENDRWSYHQRCCAHALRVCYPRGAVGLAGRIGLHLLEAGELVEAVELLLEGAEERLAESAFRTAHSYMDHYDRTLDLLEISPSDTRRVEGALVRVRLYRQQGLLGQARGILTSLEKLQISRFDEVMRASYHLENARIFLVGERLEHACAQFDIALPIWEKLGHRAQAAECILGLGEALSLRGSYVKALEYIENARERFDDLGSEVEVAWAIRTMSRVYMRRGELDVAERLQWEALRVFEQHNAVGQIANCQRAISIICTNRGKYDYAAMWNERALALFDRSGDPLGRQSCLNGFGEIARFKGHFQEAERNYRAALTVSRQSGAHDWTIPKVNLGLVLLWQEKYAEAEEALIIAFDALEQNARVDIIGGVEVAIGVCLLVKGQTKPAEACFESGYEKIRETGILDVDIAGTIELFGDKASLRGDTALTRRAWGLAIDFWDRLGDAERLAAVKAKVDWMG